MSEALTKLIEQAEIQKLQIQLNLRFKTNLALFKGRFPSTYERIKDHTPTNLILQLDPNRNLNLADKEKMVFLYGNAPKENAKNLVHSFKENPQLRRFRVVKSREQNPKHLHIRNINHLIDTYEKEHVPRIKKAPHFISNLIISGIGLGFHLNEAIRSFDIQNLFIYEHSLDALHASMHTIDWQEIVDHFKSNNKSLSLCTGVEPIKALEQIETAIHGVGLHAHIFNFVFRHADRECENEFIQTYMEKVRSFIGGLGYFDDERIGLAHAYHNLRSNNAVFISAKTQNRKTRAIIIGNGPSLDMHEDYLKRNQDNTVLVSCGTALTTLIRMGIKPDFHVEMERPTFIKEVIQYGTTREQRKGITLLCLHSVSPKTIECFDDACYAIKPNDAGTELIRGFCKDKNAPYLPFCNPTVTNCALSFLVSMGFVEVHLVGVDLGAVDEKQHHSSKSLYYDFEKYHKDKASSMEKSQVKSLEREGNFGGIVQASSVLDMSRVSMERLLSFVKSIYPDFQCFNTNNGVLIQHTESIQLSDLADAETSNKHNTLKELKSDHFFVPNSKKLDKKYLAKHLSAFFKVKDKLLLSESIRNDKELMTEATRSYIQINKNSDVLTHYMLRGTLNCVLGAIIENTLYCENQEDFLKRVHIGVTNYNQLIHDIYTRMKDNPTEIDDTINPNLSKFVKETTKDSVTTE